MKKNFSFLIKTLGCRVNQAESQEIVESLRLKGWQEGKPPDLVILNTCCVTSKAEKETRQMARALRRKYPQAFLIITGCSVDYWQMKGVAKKMQTELQADLLLNNKEKGKIECYLERF
jgi:threonylcarbamoyladenosine tRNA methylthiotransferase MtaB